MTEKRKMTMKEAGLRIEQVETELGTINQMLRVVFSEVDKCNMVLIRLLENMDLLHKEICKSCNFAIQTPKFDDIDLATHCPACQESLSSEEE
tara:strand:+ start:3349 stop:3627 length:279 start_codon:yes stop_codon:yes gene_type:complete